MRKLRVFWKTFVRSLTDFPYYKNILKARFSFSLKYLFVLLFFTSLISGLTFAFRIASLTPRIPNFVSQVKKVAKDLYPKELKITIKDNEVTTNVKEPYFIPMPSELRNLNKKNEADVSNLTNLVVIDTKATVEDFPKYNTFILVTKKSVVLPDSKNGYKIYFLDQYKELKNETVLTRAEYDLLYDKVSPYLNLLQPLAFVVVLLFLTVVPLLWTALALVWKLFTLLISAFIVWVLAIIMSRKLKYQDAYRLSMHGVTINVVLGTLLGIIGSYLNPLLGLVIFITFMFLVLKEFPKSSQTT